MVQVPKGNEFLVNINLNQLESFYRKEENSIAKIRLQAAIFRKKGKTLQEISQIVNYPLTTVGDWLRRLHNEGLERINSKKKSGRPSRLTKEKTEELKQTLRKSPQEKELPYKVWTTKLLAYYIEEKYNTHYQIRHIEKLVKKWGFSIKKARPEHQKANKELQEAFKKKFEKKFNRQFTMDSRSFVLTKHTST